MKTKEEIKERIIMASIEHEEAAHDGSPDVIYGYAWGVYDILKWVLEDETKEELR